MDHRKGFSLIEIIIVVAIAATLVLAVSGLGGNVNGLNNLVSQELQSKSDISQTLQIFTTEIRSASAAQNGAYAIELAASSSLVFYSDINKNGNAERVRYFYATSTIWKGVIQPTGTPATYPAATEVVLDLIDSVIPPTTSTPLFRYYDASYTGIQTPLVAPVDVSAIRLVGISFYSDVQPNQSPGAQYFSSLVDVRNLRSN